MSDAAEVARLAAEAQVAEQMATEVAEGAREIGEIARRYAAWAERAGSICLAAAPRDPILADDRFRELVARSAADAAHWHEAYLLAEQVCRILADDARAALLAVQKEAT